MNQIKQLQELTRNILIKAGVNVNYFYCPLPVEILIEYEWKLINTTNYGQYLEVYDETGYNLKSIVRDIYIDTEDEYFGIYDKHEDYNVIITSGLNDHVKVFTILNKSKQL